MPFVANFPFFCIMITMAGGVISSILKDKKAYYLHLFIVSLCTAMSFALLFYMYKNPYDITFMMGHFPAPWGNEIRFGPLEALIASVLSVVMLLIVIGEKERVFLNVKENKINLFFVMMNLMLSSLYALTYTNDLFTAYVFIEINTLCACGLVMAKENGKTIGATIKYLLMSLLGSGLYLISIILLYDLTGHLLMPDVKSVLDILMVDSYYILPITIIVGLIAVGIAIKSALFPFHTWMSHVYNNAMNMSNAISSGLVVKGYIILLIKIIYRVIGLDNVKSLHATNVLLFFGVLAIIVGSFDAIRENNIKRMLAYSSVGQIGYIYAGIGVATNQSILAACFVIVSHSLTKSMMFLACEGLMIASNNTKKINELKGAAYRNPIAAFAFTLGAFSMIGIPLFSGFTGKYLLSTSTIIDGGFGMWIVLTALLISTVFNASYLLNIVSKIYTRDENNLTRYKNDFNYKLAMCLFMVLNTALGLFYQPVIEVIASGLSVL